MQRKKLVVVLVLERGLNESLIRRGIEESSIGTLIIVCAESSPSDHQGTSNDMKPQGMRL